MSMSCLSGPISVGPRAIGMILAAALIALVPRAAVAEVFPWQTDSAVGSSDVSVTLDLVCIGGGLVCDLIDQYEDTQTASLSGVGEIDVDDVTNTIQFQQDSSQNLGLGLIPAYSTLLAGDLTFAEIPLTGVPMTESGVIFAITNPAVSVPGLDLTAPGDYAFTGAIDYAMIADIVGDLDLLIPMLISTPDTVTLSGVLRVLAVGDVEIRNATGTLNFQETVSLLGEMPTLVVTAALTLNLSVDVPLAIPALSPPGVGLAVALMIAMVGIARPFRVG